MDLMLEPLAWLLAVLLLSVGGVAVGAGLYQIGKQGRRAVEERFPGIGPERWQQVHGLYERLGSWVLLLAGVPLLGPLISTAAGVFDVNLATFVVLVSVSNLVRNTLLVMSVVGTYSLVAG